MNRMGAFITLVISMGISFVLWKGLDERLDIRERIVGRFRVFRSKPWLVVLVMLGVIVALGLLLVVMRVPEVVYYIVSGVALVSVLMLVNAGLRYEEPVPLRPETSGEKTSEPEAESEEAPVEAEPESTDTPAEAEEESTDTPAEAESGSTEPPAEPEAEKEAPEQAETEAPEQES